MLSHVLTASVYGVDGYAVTVEVDFRAGLPSFNIVGLPDASIRESRERVVAAIKNSGFVFSPQRITVNLAPAHLKKEGPAFDLPIAIGILVAAEIISADVLSGCAFLGELGLNGDLRAIRGVLPCAIGLQKKGVSRLVLPERNANEAAVVQGIEVLPFRTLAEVVAYLQGEINKNPHEIDRANIFERSLAHNVDFSDVKGQVIAKRALEIAAAGNHNAILVGPPGSGKTLLARRFPSILPDMEFDEALETTKIHSVAGLLRESTQLVATRPFRSPHHQVSNVALIGGGSNPKPGEVSLAHRGVLFLDEFPEFGRSVLEGLRQPLEDRFVTIARISNSVRYPSDFLLLAAANPCPCGYWASGVRPCSCAPTLVQKYRSKMSGPLLDRIDLHVEVPALKLDEITDAESSTEASAAVRERVIRARLIQKNRFAGLGIYENSRMSVPHIKMFCRLDGNARKLLKDAIRRLGLSARAYDRILKVSRTIADLEAQPDITAANVAEAIGFRFLDRPT